MTNVYPANEVARYDFIGDEPRLLGAINGPTGICYMIMKAMEVIPSLRKDMYILDQDIENTVMMLAEVILQRKGKLPIYGGSNKYRVEFCTGASGAIPMLLTAMNLYP